MNRQFLRHKALLERCRLVLLPSWKWSSCHYRVSQLAALRVSRGRPSGFLGRSEGPGAMGWCLCPGWSASRGRAGGTGLRRSREAPGVLDRALGSTNRWANLSLGEEAGWPSVLRCCGKYRRSRGSKTRHLFSHNSGERKSKRKVWAGLVSPEDSLLVVYMDIFSWCAHMLFPLCVLCPNPFSNYLR